MSSRKKGSLKRNLYKKKQRKVAKETKRSSTGKKQNNGQNVWLLIKVAGSKQLKECKVIKYAFKKVQLRMRAACK